MATFSIAPHPSRRCRATFPPRGKVLQHFVGRSHDSADRFRKAERFLFCKKPPLPIARTIKITVVPPLFAAYAASKRVNGRTRGSLPIDIPTPRPCSAAFLVPPHTLRGSLNASVSVLSCSQFLTDNLCIIAAFTGFCQLQSSFLPYEDRFPRGVEDAAPYTFSFVSHNATATALTPPTSLETIIAGSISGANPAVNPK